MQPACLYPGPQVRIMSLLQAGRGAHSHCFKKKKKISKILALMIQKNLSPDQGRARICLFLKERILTENPLPHLKYGNH